MLKNKKRPGQLSVSLNERLPEKIRNLDLGPIRYKATLAESRLGWTDEEAGLVEEEYRRYLALKYLYPEKALPPHVYVDEFWHLHILDTEKYMEDCHEIFGEYIHHFPYFGARGEEDEQVFKAAYAQTVMLYKKHFGEPSQYFWQV
jgi:hypothetical protein